MFEGKAKVCKPVACSKHARYQCVHFCNAVNGLYGSYHNKLNTYGENMKYVHNFYARSQNCEKRTVSLCLSVRMEQLVPHWTDFHEV